MPAMDARIGHTFSCSEDTFWDKVFFDEEYNRRLFNDELKFSEWREIKREDRGNQIYRVIAAAPPVGELPAALKSVVGDNVGYEERGTLDKATRRYKVEVIPNRMADKIRVAVEMWTESAGEGRCKRIATANVTAKIFGVGGIVEKKMIGDIEKSYAKSAAFTEKFIAEKGLK